MGSIPGWETKIPQASLYSQKKKMFAYPWTKRSSHTYYSVVCFFPLPIYPQTAEHKEWPYPFSQLHSIPPCDYILCVAASPNVRDLGSCQPFPPITVL